MSGANLQHLLAMILYMAAVVGIGIYFAGRANKDAESYFLGGRSLGPWVTAFSAEASDMSGYLLMGLPGLAYWTGLADAGWTCIGLAIGTYLNFLIVSKRLRRYSIAVNAFTLPDFFSNRFHEKKKIIMTICSLIIIIFFSVYAAQCLSTCGKLFANLFGFSYGGMMIVAAVFVLAYTFLGGYLAESASDFMQGVVMVTVLVLILILSVVSAGGLNTVIENAKSIDGFFSMVRTATPSTTEVNVFGAGRPYGALSIASCLAWGLGYFGMPQVLLRFMAIRHERELTASRRIATVWVLISLAVAVFIGLVGRTLFPTALITASEAENVFIYLSRSLLPAALAPFPAMLLEVCSGCDYAARTGLWASGLCCAALSVQGASVLLQVRTLCPPEVSFKPLLWGRVLHLPLSLSLFYLGLPQDAVESFNTLCARVVPMQRVPIDCALLVFAVCCITACEACRLTEKRAQNATPTNKNRSAACKPPQNVVT